MQIRAQLVPAFVDGAGVVALLGRRDHQQRHVVE
jgi:hypothetical protein